MILTAVAALTLAQQPLSAGTPFSQFDGSSWAGLSIGTLEPDLKKRFKTSKSTAADPATVRVASDRSDVAVFAVFRQTGGKSDMVGIAVEGERNSALTTLDRMKDDLGAPDGELFPGLRTTDWSLVWWKSKGIGAVVAGDRERRVLKVLMAPSATLAARLETWETRPTEVQQELRLQIGSIDFTVSTDPKDRDAEAAVSSYVRRSAGEWLANYRGEGWELGRSSNRISLRVDLRNKKQRTVEASASIFADTSYGTITASGSASEVVQSDVEAGLYVGETIQRALRKLGANAREQLRKPLWQAEWRPFYAFLGPGVIVERGDGSGALLRQRYDID